MSARMMAALSSNVLHVFLSGPLCMAWVAFFPLMKKGSHDLTMKHLAHIVLEPTPACMVNIKVWCMQTCGKHASSSEAASPLFCFVSYALTPGRSMQPMQV